LKYVPRTGEWGEAEVCQVTFTPVETPNLTVEWHKVATGTIAFRRATWAELPTKHHVVNALANLPVVETPAALVAHSRGGKSYVDTRILKIIMRMPATPPTLTQNQGARRRTDAPDPVPLSI